jgi:hypothetical protein
VSLICQKNYSLVVNPNSVATVTVPWSFYPSLPITAVGSPVSGTQQISYDPNTAILNGKALNWNINSTAIVFSPGGFTQNGFLFTQIYQLGFVLMVGRFNSFVGDSAAPGYNYFEFDYVGTFNNGNPTGVYNRGNAFFMDDNFANCPVASITVTTP